MVAVATRRHVGVGTPLLVSDVRRGALSDAEFVLVPDRDALYEVVGGVHATAYGAPYRKIGDIGEAVRCSDGNYYRLDVGLHNGAPTSFLIAYDVEVLGGRHRALRLSLAGTGTALYTERESDALDVGGYAGGWKELKAIRPAVVPINSVHVVGARFNNGSYYGYVRALGDNFFNYASAAGSGWRNWDQIWVGVATDTALYGLEGGVYLCAIWDKDIGHDRMMEIMRSVGDNSLRALYAPPRTWFLLGAGGTVLLSSSPSAAGSESSQLVLLRTLSASQTATGTESALLGRLRPIDSSLAASGTQTSDLPVLRGLSSSPAASASQSAALSRLVRIDFSGVGTASIAADLLVSGAGQVLLSASLTGAGSSAASAAILRSLLLSSSGALSLSSSLAMDRGLGAAPAGAATLSAVTALIRGLSSSVSGALAHTADLFVGVPLAASPAGSGTLSGALAPVRGLTLDGVVTASLSALQTLVRSLSAAPAGAADLSALLTGPALLLDASLAGSASLGAVLVRLWEPSPPSGGSWTPTAPVGGVWTLVVHPPATWS